MPTRLLLSTLLWLAASGAPGVAGATDAPATAASPPLPMQLMTSHASRYFAEAAARCRADGGKLWGVSLCGPMLLVDPLTRNVVASQADGDGYLRPAGDGTFVGVLPADQTIANTSTDWSGTRWIELVWPLPEDPAARRTLLAHESYHLVQARVAPISGGEDNVQLGTLYGRYTLQLELRALAAALHATGAAARRAAAGDALLFRAARHHEFPEARAAEVALERNEGLAEYTGVMVGNATGKARTAMALADIHLVGANPSFVRSFAYATGPAYGLLLDYYRRGWRKQVAADQTGMAAMLAAALHVDLANAPPANVTVRAARYAGPILLAAETARQAEAERQLAHWRATLVEGAVLVLPLKHMKVQFDPRNILPLGEHGTIYPSLRVVDDWGSIDINQGGLLASDWKRLTVVAPGGPDTTGTLTGAGWTLKLASGWQLVPASRVGDMTLRQTLTSPPN